MGYLYAGLWLAACVLLFVRFRRESAAVYVLCVYFLFAGVWWLIDQLSEWDMLHGTPGNVMRGVSAAALLITGIVYYIEKRRKQASQSSSE